MDKPARKYVSIDVAQATLDLRHSYSYPTVNELISESVATHGVINPITVVKNNENSFNVIAGFKRAEAAKAAGLNKIDATIVTSHDHRKLFIIYLSENLSHRKLNLVECSKVIKTAVDNLKFDNKAVLGTILPMLGYAKSSYVLASLMKISNFGPEAHFFLYLSKSQISVANHLARMGNEQRESVCNWLLKNKFSLSRSTKLLEMISDLAERHRLLPKTIIDEAENKTQQHDEKKPRANRLYEHIFSWHNPSLMSMESHFANAVSSMSLPRQIRVIHPTNFEGTTIRLEIEAKSTQEIKSAAKILSLADDKLLKTLFNWL